MSDVTTGERTAVRRIEFAVDWPPGHAAAYLIEGPEPILVDAGSTGNRGTTELRETLTEFGYDPAEIRHLIITHPHIDHVGQVQTVLDAADPTVYAPVPVRTEFDRDIDTVEAATRRNLRETGVESDRLDGAVDRLLWAHRTNRECLPVDAVDHWLTAGESVSIAGLSFESIFTPGHQQSHFCYATGLGGDRVLFSGDMAIEPFRAAAIHANFDDGVQDSVRAYFETLDRLADCEFDRVYPGHGPIHEEFERTVADSRQDLQNRVDRCLDALKPNSGQTALDLARKQSDSDAGRRRILPEVVGALAVLEEQGHVQSSVIDKQRRYRRTENSRA